MEDMLGKVFGELTVMELMEERRGGHRVWLCGCICGGSAFRTTGQLTEAAKLGHTPSCRKCALELRSGRRIEKASMRDQRLLETWYIAGTLYLESTVQRMEDDALKALEEADLGYQRSAIQVEPSLYEISYPAAPREVKRQLGWFIYPIKGDGDKCWACLECKGFFEKGYGCILCVEPVCQKCIDQERHYCREMVIVRRGGEYTLEDIGAEFLVSRERARQMEMRALMKLRHPSRARLLGEILSTDPCLRIRPNPPPLMRIVRNEPVISKDQANEILCWIEKSNRLPKSFMFCPEDNDKAKWLRKELPFAGSWPNLPSRQLRRVTYLMSEYNAWEKAALDCSQKEQKQKLVQQTHAHAEMRRLGLI